MTHVESIKKTHAPRCDITKERIMQERFCKCGHRLMVQYTLDGFIPWEAVIVDDGIETSPVKVCPCCGSYLSIHFLR